MRCRVAVTILVCLFLGGVLQAVVACVLALRSPMTSGGFNTGVVVGVDILRPGTRNEPTVPPDWASTPLLTAPERSARAAAFEMWPRLRGRRADDGSWFMVQHWKGAGADFASGFSTDAGVNLRNLEQWNGVWMQRYWAGWPMRSMVASVDHSRGVRGGIVAPNRWMAQDRVMMMLITSQPPVQAVVPLRPLPLGTAVNSLVFGAPFLLVPLARRARRRRRARAGKCPRCGYSRAGLAGTVPCPECGSTPADGSPGESGGGVGAAAPASAEV